MCAQPRYDEDAVGGGDMGGGRGVKRRANDVEPARSWLWPEAAQPPALAPAAGPRSLSGPLKRVRLERTPGELRLERDILECGDLVTRGWLQLSLLSTCIVLAWVPGARGRTYHIHVSKRYPHVPPTVYDMTDCGEWGERVTRGLLAPGAWTPVAGLREVLESLEAEGRCGEVARGARVAGSREVLESLEAEGWCGGGGGSAGCGGDRGGAPEAGDVIMA